METLTQKQLTVMSLKAMGKSNRQIAGELGINESTVYEHIQAAVKKLGAHNAAHCITLFTQQELAKRLRDSGIEETLRAFIQERTGKGSLSEISMEDGLVDVLDYVDSVLMRVDRND